MRNGLTSSILPGVPRSSRLEFLNDETLVGDAVFLGEVVEDGGGSGSGDGVEDVFGVGGVAA